jgi:hypothetical protein
MSIANSTYGVMNVTASLPVNNYPMTASGKIGDKLVMQLKNGYATTTAAPINLLGYNPLWFNPTIDYYVYKQSPATINSNITLQLTNLTNP